jgi:hypothetical protein
MKKPQIMPEIDPVLESHIRVSKDLMLSAERTDIRGVYAEAVRKFIALRTPETVTAMEVAKGLR